LGAGIGLVCIRVQLVHTSCLEPHLEAIYHLNLQTFLARSPNTPSGGGTALVGRWVSRYYWYYFFRIQRIKKGKYVNFQAEIAKKKKNNLEKAIFKVKDASRNFYTIFSIFNA